MVLPWRTEKQGMQNQTEKKEKYNKFINWIKVYI
jgi:hypothetical protein